MSLWDWVQAGLGGTDTSLADYKGSYKVTTGTTLGSYIGGRHTHVFGPDIRMVVDPEELLAQTLPPSVTAVASGLTGNALFTFGTMTTATYVGPKVDIHRAPKMSRVSSPFRVGLAEDEQADPLNKASAIAVAALSTLAIASAAGFELAMYIHYRDFTDSTKGPGPAPKLFATASYAIPSRSLAIVKVVETSSCYGSWAEASLIRAGETAVWNGTITACRNRIAAIREAFLAWQERRTQQADEAVVEVTHEIEGEE